MIGVDRGSTVVCAAVPVDLARFQRKFDAGRWRGQRKRRKAARRFERLRRRQWQYVSFTFGSIELVSSPINFK